MLLPHFDVFCDLLLNRRTATWNLFVLYNNETNFYRYSFFISKSFNITRKPVSAHFGEHEKTTWRNLLSIQNEAISLVAMRSKELWLVRKNHATVKLDSSFASRGMKTYSGSRIELRNLQILTKMLEKTSQFLSSEQPCEPKNLDFALNIAGVEKYARKTCGSGQSGGHSIRVLNERSVSNGGNLCPLWLVIFRSVWNSVGDTV